MWGVGKVCRTFGGKNSAKFFPTSACCWCRVCLQGTRTAVLLQRQTNERTNGISLPMGCYQLTIGSALSKDCPRKMSATSALMKMTSRSALLAWIMTSSIYDLSLIRRAPPRGSLRASPAGRMIEQEFRAIVIGWMDQWNQPDRWPQCVGVPKCNRMHRKCWEHANCGQWMEGRSVLF